MVCTRAGVDDRLRRLVRNRSGERALATRRAVLSRRYGLVRL
jgi:hypothetical protein